MNTTRKTTITTTREYDEEGRIVAEKVETVTEEETVSYHWHWTVPLPAWTPQPWADGTIITTGGNTGGTYTLASGEAN